jgi:hypothetical protein
MNDREKLWAIIFILAGIAMLALLVALEVAR